MPVFIEAVAVNLDELFENGGLTAIALLSKLSRVMVVTVYFPIVLVIRVLGAKNCRTDTAGKMLDMVFTVECCNV